MPKVPTFKLLFINSFILASFLSPGSSKSFAPGPLGSSHSSKSEIPLPSFIFLCYSKNSSSSDGRSSRLGGSGVNTSEGLSRTPNSSS